MCNDICINQLSQVFVDAIPAYVFWKDRDSKYLGCNLRYSIATGLRHPDEIIGKDDTDFYPLELALKYQNDDQQVISNGKPMHSIIERIVNPITKPGEFINCSLDKLDILLVETTKVPLYSFSDSKEIIGVLGIYLPKKKYAEKYELIVIRRLEQISQKAQRVCYVGNL